MTDHNFSLGTGDKISISITRKTEGDKVVSQWAIQRWFANEQRAVDTMIRLVSDLVVAFNNVDGKDDD